MPDESNGEKDELADLLAEEGVVQWKERALQAAVLAPLLRDKQLQLNKRRKGKSPTAALQSFLEQQHRDVALSSGYSSRAVRAALQQVTSRLNDIRPEDQQESNDTWLQLRLQQQFLLAHRRFRKLQRQKFKKQRQEVEASTSDKSERSLSTGSAHANSHGATSQTSKSRPRLVLRLGSSKRNKKTDNQGKADPGAAAPNKREQTVDGVPGGQRFSRAIAAALAASSNASSFMDDSALDDSANDPLAQLIAKGQAQPGISSKGVNSSKLSRLVPSAKSSAKPSSEGRTQILEVEESLMRPQNRSSSSSSPLTSRETSSKSKPHYTNRMKAVVEKNNTQKKQQQAASSTRKRLDSKRRGRSTTAGRTETRCSVVGDGLGPLCPLCEARLDSRFSNAEVNKHMDRCLRGARSTRRKPLAEALDADHPEPTGASEDFETPENGEDSNGEEDSSESSEGQAPPRKVTRDNSHSSSGGAAIVPRKKKAGKGGRASTSVNTLKDDWNDGAYRRRVLAWDQQHRYVPAASASKVNTKVGDAGSTRDVSAVPASRKSIASGDRSDGADGSDDDDGDDSKQYIESDEDEQTQSEDEDDFLDVELDGGLVVPRALWDRLFGYQQLALKWLWELHLADVGGILADEMGLGKTAQAVSIISSLHYSRRLTRPILVVCPATVLAHWVKEFHTWYPPLRVFVMHSSGEGLATKRLTHRSLLRKAEMHTGVVIATYGGLRNNDFQLLGLDWNYVILDEGHLIRNPDAQITQIAKRLRSRHRLILTGAPVQNNLKELWSLVDFVHPGRLGTLPSFEDSFATPLRIGGYAGASQLAVQAAYRCAVTLRGILAPLVLRRMKDSVGNETSMADVEKTERVLFCRLTPHQINMYRAVLRDNAESLRGLSRVSSASALFSGRRRGRRSNTAFRVISLLRKICNHPSLADQSLQRQAAISVAANKRARREAAKGAAANGARSDEGAPAPQPPIDINSQGYGAVSESGKLVVLDRILPLWHRAGHRCLLFSSTTSMLSIIELVLRRHGFSYLRMDGSTPVSKRPGLIEQFNSDENNVFAFLLTSRVGGVGINLTGADRVILFEPDWNPSTDIQARERCWRIGQDKDVTVYRLITAGCIEEKIYQRQIFKLFLSNKILNGRAQHRLFSQKHLRDLFTLDVDEPAEGEGATIRVSTRRQDIHRQASRTQEQNLQRVLHDRADIAAHRGSRLGSDSGEEDGEAELTTLALAKQLEKPAAVTETEGLFEGVSIREAAGAISKRERQQRELRKRQKLQAGKRHSQSSSYLLGSDASSDSSSSEDDWSRGIGDLSRPTNGARASTADSLDADNTRAAESMEEKSLVKALLSSDDIRGTFNHDKAEGTVDVAAAHVTAQQASRIATQALAQLQRSRIRVQARPVHQPTWTGLMGSSGRGGGNVGGENGARSLLDQIKRRKASLQGADQATAGSNGEQSVRGLGVAKVASAASASSLAASSTVRSRVDVAEDLLRRMTHWFRRRNGVAPTRDVLRAFRDDGDNGDITPNIFKGLLLSICAFKRGYWILNEDGPHNQPSTAEE